MKQLMPQFMRDSSSNDGHAEPVMDYVISWCLRRADVICKDEKPILYSHCRFMLGKLLGIEKFGFNLFSFYELLENDTQTESDLFNEFWYRWGDARF